MVCYSGYGEKYCSQVYIYPYMLESVHLFLQQITNSISYQPSVKYEIFQHNI